METILQDIGYSIPLNTETDKTFVYYLALDFGLFSILTDDAHWKEELGRYNSTLLSFLQDHKFKYFLSGIYWWESFRLQTVPLILQCMMAKAIPLFHYCSECVDEGRCSHHYCKLWLLHACNTRRIDVNPGDDAMKGSIIPPTHEHGLTLLAKVATEELQKIHKSHSRPKQTRTLHQMFKLEPSMKISTKKVRERGSHSNSQGTRTAN